MLSVYPKGVPSRFTVNCVTAQGGNCYTKRRVHKGRAWKVLNLRYGIQANVEVPNTKKVVRPRRTLAQLGSLLIITNEHVRQMVLYGVVTLRECETGMWRSFAATICNFLERGGEVISQEEVTKKIAALSPSISVNVQGLSRLILEL